MIGLIGMHHIGVTVPDLDAAATFFRDILDGVEIMETGPIDADNRFMQRNLGALETSRIDDIRVLRLGNGLNLELFQYRGDEGADGFQRNSKTGAFHIALEVKNLDEAVKRLRVHGVDLLEGPTLIDAGPMEGLNWIYFRTPWGQNMELVSAPGPLGYEQTGGPLMWSPKAE